ncbi:MAG TPA: hypothetical protein PLN55_06280 [Burkholderiaceae bacterium]|nr:hypothetical protein [Burkholderiaceae bacterium]
MRHAIGSGSRGAPVATLLRRAILPRMAALLALLAPPALVHAQAAAGLEPPGYPAALLGAQPTLAKPAARSASLGSYLVQLEATSLGLLARAAGAPLTRERDGEDVHDWICMAAREAGRPLRVWAHSSAADGPVSGVQIEAGGTPDKRCPELPANMQPVSLGEGLRLGLTRAEVLKRLGPPSHEDGGWLMYVADRSLPPAPAAAGKPPRPRAELSIVALHLSGGRVDRMLASLATDP